MVSTTQERYFLPQTSQLILGQRNFNSYISVLRFREELTQISGVNKHPSPGTSQIN